MKQSYALLGVLFIILIVGAAYAFNHPFIQKSYTGNESDRSSMTTSTLQLASSAFENNGKIPAKYTCDLPAQAGDNQDLNPPLSISGAPETAKSLVLIMDDPDVPKALRLDGTYDHWIVFNIPPPAPNSTLEIAEGGPVPGTVGRNSSGKNAYTGPCPPPDYEPSEHRYFFKLYALDSGLQLSEGALKEEVERAMKGHILEKAQLIGRYKRK